MCSREQQNIIIQYLKNYNPIYIGIFGSYSRNESNANSDLDLLVKFRNAISLIQLLKIENELSERIGIKVDLVTEGALKNEIIKSSIKNDLELIYQV